MQPYLRYPGGKSRIAKKIVAKLPPHETYVEPMVGGGSVYFAKERSTKEIISDIDTSLMNFYRDLKAGKVKRCNMTPNKTKFERIRAKSKKNSSLSSCEYLYLNKLSYGGKMGTTMDPAAKIKCKGKKAKTCGVASKNHETYSERLNKTRIESGDFKKKISKHDSKDTLFYLDPPYVTKTTDYYRNGEQAPQEMKKTVDKIKGKFVLSYNNSKQIRDIFCKKYDCEKIKTTYSINKHDLRAPATELIIKNYRCKLTKGRKICKKV